MSKQLILVTMAVTMFVTACGSGDSAESQNQEQTAQVQVFPTPDTVVESPQVRGKTYIVAQQRDSAYIYRDSVVSEDAFIVISKGEYRLYVYDIVDEDTVLAASFPICYALKTEQKTRSNDNCTPECDMQHPFKVCEIKDVRTWTFDFDDGRGKILAFGHWFLRLDLSGGDFEDHPSVADNRSIGIHGSTGNELSVPGRDSHGCIRLRDGDLEVLHDKYVHMGTHVVIRPYRENKYEFERRAEEQLGESYRAPISGVVIPACVEQYEHDLSDEIGINSDEIGTQSN